MTKYTLTDEHRARFPEWRDACKAKAALVEVAE